MICFYKLSKNQLIQLYSAADLYTTPATSIFETCGRSPIEALRGNTPIFLPEWSGFEEYTLPHHGRIAPVNHYEKPILYPFHFAQTDKEQYSALMYEMLTEPFSLEVKLPEWADQTHSFTAIRSLIETMMRPRMSFFQPYPEAANIAIELLSETVAVFLDYLQVKTLAQLLEREKELGIISRKFIGDMEFLRFLHQQFFRDLAPLESAPIE